MADEQPTAEQPDVKPSDVAPHGDGETREDIDWKAESRKWESRAKANKSAADELEQLKQSQMTEQQKAEAKAEKLQKKLEALESARQHDQWISQVSKDTGVPADVLRGDSLESIQRHADAIKKAFASKPSAPTLRGIDHQPSNPTSGGGDWIRNAFRKR